ncbi:MAG: 50S ribosomal protein L5 [Cyanobacteria bacterium NC_groundwater_1444_Ag_S-0.65um_54_12]|nr:50S ribosomal protein L5 [Cyanobacteria bacterium NC_groundwater_1444_Ag_S-0.65um_54_12]
MPRLKDKYEQEIAMLLKSEFDYPNLLAVPRLVKIVLNIGLGEAIQNPKAVPAAVNDLANIVGQRPVVTKAKKSIATFKVRARMNIGAMVTLRGRHMWEFLDKLMNLALPRIRDFRGVNPKSFDGKGNYSLGIKEQLIFPEIDYDKVDRIRGMDITIVTTARTDAEARSLLKLLGMPFRAQGA